MHGICLIELLRIIKSRLIEFIWTQKVATMCVRPDVATSLVDKNASTQKTQHFRNFGGGA